MSEGLISKVLTAQETELSKPSAINNPSTKILPDCLITSLLHNCVSVGSNKWHNIHYLLRRLEPVSTLPSDALIRRIGTTTLYHVLAILWYQMKHKLLLNKIKSLLWRNMSPWQWASPVKTPFILCLVAYISKTNSVTPIFYFWKVIRRAWWHFVQSFKKFCLEDSVPP